MVTTTIPVGPANTRAPTVEERQKALAAMPQWLARGVRIRLRKLLDEGYVRRLTNEMISWKIREAM